MIEQLVRSERPEQQFNQPASAGYACGPWNGYCSYFLYPGWGWGWYGNNHHHKWDNHGHNNWNGNWHGNGNGNWNKGQAYKKGNWNKY